MKKYIIHQNFIFKRPIYSIGLIFLSITIICLYSCKKSVLVPPPTTEIVGATLFNNDASASAAIAGIYQSLVNTSFIASVSNGSTNFTAVSALSADEFTLYHSATSALLQQAYVNSISGNTLIPYWKDLYNVIYQCNNAIESLSNGSNVTATLKQQLIGEAEFVRAFCYFYLVNMFGNVALTTTSNYITNESLGQSPSVLVYQQIVADLKDAQSKLSDGFVSPTGQPTSERTLPNKTASTALLARVYLYTKDYADAQTAATIVINNSSNATLVPNLNNVFLMNSDEALWQLPPVKSGFNTSDGYAFILNGNFKGLNSSQRVEYLSNQLLDAFEAGDLRRINWVGNYNTYYFANKYKVQGGQAGTPVTEYYMMLRLAEQYLIRSEARAQLNDLSGAAADLNIIRNRAGLPNTTAVTQTDFLNAIQHERQIELFAELGHRWLDLKRTGAIDSVMTKVVPLKGGNSWNSTAQLFPIPVSDIIADPNLKQNPGY
ncbi:MAG TPA: RagB/SusD family nutrient uptake outer membrane protein [Mucilaginibacter sp.]|nr:RagB/SusD family nutrient uptake outer membrane protein [Mucilaginibacter sp.]